MVIVPDIGGKPDTEVVYEYVPGGTSLFSISLAPSIVKGGMTILSWSANCIVISL